MLNDERPDDVVPCNDTRKCFVLLGFCSRTTKNAWMTSIGTTNNGVSVFSFVVIKNEPALKSVILEAEANRNVLFLRLQVIPISTRLL